MKKWLMIFFLCAASLQGIQARDLFFDELTKAEMTTEPVKMRGFLYQKDATWILAAVPNLRSCCLATHEQANKQVLLEGDFSLISQQSIVTVEGFLVYEHPFYRLKQATLVQTQGSTFPLMTICIAILALAIAYIFRLLTSRR